MTKFQPSFLGRGKQPLGPSSGVFNQEGTDLPPDITHVSLSHLKRQPRKEDSEQGNLPLHGFQEGNGILFDIRFIFPNALRLLLLQGLLDGKETAAKTICDLAFTVHGPGDSGAEEELQDWESAPMDVSHF